MSDFEKDTNEEIEAVTPESEAPAVEAEETATPEVTEAPVEEAPKRQYAGHMTASAAALNAAGEVDIRRRRPREEKKIKESN